jgi:hypothetical protein
MNGPVWRPQVQKLPSSPISSPNSVSSYRHPNSSSTLSHRSRSMVLAAFSTVQWSSPSARVVSENRASCICSLTFIAFIVHCMNESI